MERKDINPEMIQKDDEDLVAAYHQCFDGSPLAFCLIRVMGDEKERVRDAEIVYLNPALEDLVKKDRNILTSQKLTDLFAGVDPGWLKYLKDVVTDGKTVERTEYNKRLHKYLHIQGYKVSEDLCGSLITNVTRQTQLEIQENEYSAALEERTEQLKSALKAANQASTAKSNFLSRMSHEIRTPLNAIIGMDTIAAQSIGNTEKVADCISKIGLSARYLLSLINDILDMSRIESGKMLLKNDYFRFDEFIASINDIIYPQATSKGLDYECTVSYEVDDAYIGDEMKLQQIILNVLGNAVKFTTRGKVSLEVSLLSREAKRSMLRFVLNDTGCGICAEDQERIFEAFEQADTSTTAVFGGTGLGLAITKSLVGLMGGTIRVRSIVDIGSEFTIDIPLTTDGSTVVRPRPQINLRNMHTLIVDDDLLICEQTDAILRDIGMIGEWVTTGQEAVNRVQIKSEGANFYDFILIDWKMPDMDGLETTQRIRRIVGPEVTIIIISAYDWQAIESEARAAGANMLISKPLLRTTLISAFEKALGKDEEMPGTEQIYDFSGCRVLVAEDNKLNAEIAKVLLESRNFVVEDAGNGIKALEKFVQNPVGYYDAILMDVRMPMLDGLQATVNIRNWGRPDAKTIPIIAMTANAFDEDVEKSRAAGMNAHLSKPIDPPLLFSTLYRLIHDDDDVD
jgi:two-component system sensor histidine kinase/response regulator